MSAINRNISRQVSVFLDKQDLTPEQLGEEYLFLDLLNRFYTELQSFDSYMEQREIVGAATTCRELKYLMDRLMNLPLANDTVKDTHNNSKRPTAEIRVMLPEEIGDMLEDQYLQRTAVILHLAAELEKEFLSLGSEEISIKTRVLQVKNNRFHDTPLSLGDFHSILEVLSLQDEFNQKLADGIFNNQSWNPAARPLSIFEIVRSSLSVSYLKKSLPVGSGGTEADILAASLEHMAIFISECIFPVPHRPNDAFLSAFHAYVHHFTDTLLGCSEQALQSLETCLFETGMITDSTELALFSTDSTKEQHLDYLHAVQDILTSKDYTSIAVIEGTERGMFVFDLLVPYSVCCR